LKTYLEELYKTTNYVKKDDNEYILNSKYRIGKIKILNSYAILESIDNKSYKINIDLDKLNGAYDKDIVLVQILFNPKGKIKAKVINTLQKATHTILCYIKDKKIFSFKENIFLDNLKDSNIIEKDIILYDNNTIIKHIGNIKDSSIDELISLYLYNQEYRANDHKTDKNFIPNSSSRVDLTDLDFCTIDPKNAKDFDDAIYFDKENSTLFVAIADVSAYIQEGSTLDIEAKKRAFSIYLPHKVIPMLPFELSNNLCSLVPDEPRLAYVFKIKLDLKNISVISSELFEATIISKHRYTYGEIDKILGKKEDQYFRDIFEFTKKFKNKRIKTGYDFRSNEIRQVLTKDQNLDYTFIEYPTASHSLIEECMLLANCEAAKKLKQIGIFRVHNEPSQAAIVKLIDEVKALGIKAKLKANIHDTIEQIQKKARNLGIGDEVDELIIQSQQQAQYSSIKKQHFGLGFDNYSHFTSPIRRYADLVLHRILKTGKIPKDIEDICQNISDTQRVIDSLVWDFEDRKYSRWAQENIGKIFKAKIVDKDNGIAKIEDKITGARVICENYAGEKLFSDIKVTIKDTNIIMKKIIVTIL